MPRALPSSPPSSRALDPRAAFPVVHHMTTAHLEATRTADTNALPSADLGACFGNLVDTLELDSDDSP